MLSENNVELQKEMYGMILFIMQNFFKSQRNGRYRYLCINMDGDLLILGDKNMDIYIYPLHFSD